jgi:hypothetical protein
MPARSSSRSAWMAFAQVSSCRRAAAWASGATVSGRIGSCLLLLAVARFEGCDDLVQVRGDLLVHLGDAGVCGGLGDGDDLQGCTDDDALPSGQLDRSRINLRDPTLRFDGLLAAAALASTPSQYESVIDLAYELMPQAHPHQGNGIAQALALLPAAGRALLDPRSLASHESEWIRSLAAAVWSTADGQPPQVGHRLAADPSGNVRRSLASHLPDKPHYADLRIKLEARRPPVCPHRPEDSRLRPSAQDQSAGASGVHVRNASISCPHPHRLCRAESRALPAGITNRVGSCYPASFGLAHDLASGTYTNTSDRPSLVGRLPRCLRPSGLDPMAADGCSMVARMPRYVPTASGSRSESRISVTA